MKVTLNLPTELVDTLKFNALKRKTSVTSVFVDALYTMKGIKEHMAPGDKLLLERTNGNTFLVSFE